MHFARLFVPLRQVSKVLSLGKTQIYLVFRSLIRTFADMNWKFILSWAIKFALSTVVYSFAAKLTNSLWWAFLMAIGFLIFIAILESYIEEWIEKWREKRQ